jgi:glycosyltransferase involved in cell wall biosynthesis
MKLLYIIGTYPRLTETFIDREIRTLEELGTEIKIVSVRRPSGALSQEQANLIDRIKYLLPVDIGSLLMGHIRYAVGRPGKFFGAFFYLLSCPHPSFRSRIKTFLHFGEGVYAANELRRVPFDHIHAHFMDRAATVALVISRLLGVPYSLTAHAGDIYVDPILLQEKMAGAKFITTCTGYNKAHLEQFGEGLFNHKLFCIYHSLMVDDYNAREPRGSDESLILSVGQLKERKGFNYLLLACRLLADRGITFKCQIVGEGPQRASLETQIKELSLENLVQLCGALPHENVIEKYQQANLFVLPAILAADGDRDGIPNVILEAMAMNLPVVSTDHSAIPEVVIDGVNGLLVSPADEHALADALEKILTNPGLGKTLGSRGRQIVVEKFDPVTNSKLLLDQFRA